MKRLFFLYIPVSLFALIFIVNGLRGMTTEKENALYSQAVQLFEPEPDLYFTGDLEFSCQSGADEGITAPHGRRFGLNKPLKCNVFFRNNINEGKYKTIKLSVSGNNRHFIQYLTTRHSQGFYIYSLKELLL